MADSYSFATAINALAEAPPAVGEKTAMGLLRQMDSLGLPPSTIAYNAALRCVGKGGKWKTSLSLLRRMQQEEDGVPPANTLSYNAAISACKESKRWRGALELLGELEEHRALRADVVSYSSARAGGDCRIVRDCVGRCTDQRHAKQQA